MTRSQSLKAALAADPAVLALVNNGDSPITTRVYPLVALPTDLLPTVAYEFAATCEYTMDSVGPVTAQLDIKSWAASYDLAHQLADAIHDVLCPPGNPRGFTGLLGGAGGINVIQCLWADGSRETERVVAISSDQYAFEVRSPYDLMYDL